MNLSGRVLKYFIYYYSLGFNSIHKFFLFLLLGDELNDVVNCFDGSVMEKMPIRYFWRGFEKFKERPACKEPVALLKLKVSVWSFQIMSSFV